MATTAASMDDKYYPKDEWDWDTEEAVDQRMPETLQALTDELLRTRQEAISAKTASGVEKRWEEDEKELGGLEIDMSRVSSVTDYATGNASIRNSQSPTRSEVIINIVRGKTETMVGRFQEMILPTDYNNWGLKNTPDPELDKMELDQRPAMQAGQPVTDQQGNRQTMADVAVSKRELAKERMDNMETAISDQLTECRYNGVQRECIDDAGRLGVMILKGPEVIRSTRKKYQPVKGFHPETGEPITVHKLDFIEDLQPGSKRVDPWNFFPAPGCGPKVRKAAYTWEVDTITPRELRDLIGVEGYDEDAILMVLNEEPQTVACKQARKQRKTKSLITHGQSYETWEYNGDVPRVFLEQHGVDLADDLLNVNLTACVVFVNDRPIKVALNPLEGEGVPYDSWQWCPIDKDSPWGSIGVPRMLLWLQRVITGAWRLIMDNAGDSSGANFVFGEGIEPIDDFWELTGKKGWRYTGTLDDVRKAFAQFQIQNNQEQLQAIIELALRFVDLETSTPSLFQGETKTAPETLGATNIMVDANNVSLRGRTQRYDDEISRPHISRYYHWNMQHNPDPDIKGEFEVDPRGVSVLLERDQQYQDLLQLWQLKGDPDVALRVDWDKALDQLLRARRLDVLREPEEIEAAQEQMQAQPQQQANPALEVAQVRAEGDMAKETLRQESDMAELQFKAEQAEKDRQHEEKMERLRIQGKILEYAERNKMDIAKVRAQLAISAAGMKNREAVKAPQVATPPTEPAGRAPAGEAYQK